MTIPSKIYREEHELFRKTVAGFIEAEIAPYYERWEKEGQVSREVWRKAGEAGLLLTDIPENYGGAGADFLFSAVMIEEMAKRVYAAPGFRLHSDIVAPYILNYGSEEQKRTWLPRMAKGEVITAIAMTEPGTGSDLQAIRTTALRQGNELVLNGQKTFITNGGIADLVIVAAKTDTSAGAKGVTLVLVETDRPGFKRGRNLKKIGQNAQDTAELFFEDVRVPPSNILGEEGRGFACLMNQLPRERLLVAIGAVAIMEAALQWTVDYTRERRAFGKAIAEFQNTRFKLAEVKTEVVVARVFLDRCLELFLEGNLDATNPALLKSCGLMTASALIVTIHDHAAIDEIVHVARQLRSDLVIVARARDATHARHLYGIGVTDAVPETIEASLQLSEAALVGLGLPTGPVIASIHEKRDEFRHELQEAAGGNDTHAIRPKELP